MSEPIKTEQISLFFQAQPGKAPVFLGNCASLDTIPDPRVTSELITCSDGNGGYTIRGEKVQPPSGKIEFDVGLYYETAADVLDDAVCPGTLYALARCSGKAGIFGGWTRAAGVGHIRVQSADAGPFASRDSSQETIITRSLSGWWPRMDWLPMTLSRKTTTEAQALNSITKAARVLCGDACGKQVEMNCDTLYAVADCNTGVATANCLVSTDGGNVWAATAADPFGVNTEHAMTIRAFQHGANGTRLLALRSTNAGTALEASYSDDAGATWTEVALGATVGEAAYGDGSLCVIDDANIWAASTVGNVYKSTDGGTTWTVQASALVASGGASIAAIDFMDKDIGYFVGSAGDVVAKTVDGGANWTAMTATGAGAGLRSVVVLTANRVLIGTSNGRLYMTFDGGTTYERKIGFSTNGVGAVLNLKKFDEYTIFMVHNNAGPLGYVSRSIDGGHTWEVLNYVNNDQLNALTVCDRNLVHVVGEVVDAGTAFIGTADRVRSALNA